MYITRLSAKKFKCFDSIDIELPKLTLFTGANSSGKSSLLHALLVPFQSHGFPLYLSPNGKYVNMGDFYSMAHCNRRREIIHLDFTIQTEKSDVLEFKTSWMLDPTSSLPQLKDLHARGNFLNISIQKISDRSGYIAHLQHAKGLSKQDEFKFSKQVVTYVIDSIEKHQPKELEHKKPKKTLYDVQQRLFALTNIRGRRFPDIEQLQTQLRSMMFVPRLFAAFSTLDNRFNFISSFRLEPERTYYQRAKADRKIGRSGENHIEQIFEWERRRAPEFSALQNSLKNLGLISGLRTHPIKGGRLEVTVKADRGGIWASLTDVGFGISQFLPIAVADFQLPEGSTLAVAQPEIHLHPKLQAALGNYLVERVQKHNRRYILETHSEYLLNRIRLLIVKGDIEPSEIGIYYFQCSGCKTRVYRVTFTKSGKIEGAPQDFFDTYMMDVMDIAMKAK